MRASRLSTVFGWSPRRRAVPRRSCWCSRYAPVACAQQQAQGHTLLGAALPARAIRCSPRNAAGHRRCAGRTTAGRTAPTRPPPRSPHPQADRAVPQPGRRGCEPCCGRVRRGAHRAARARAPVESSPGPVTPSCGGTVVVTAPHRDGRRPRRWCGVTLTRPGDQGANQPENALCWESSGSSRAEPTGSHAGFRRVYLISPSFGLSSDHPRHPAR